MTTENNSNGTMRKLISMAFYIAMTIAFGAVTFVNSRMVREIDLLGARLTSVEEVQRRRNETVAVIQANQMIVTKALDKIDVSLGDLEKALRNHSYATEPDGWKRGVK